MFSRALSPCPLADIRTTWQRTFSTVIPGERSENPGSIGQPTREERWVPARAALGRLAGMTAEWGYALRATCVIQFHCHSSALILAARFAPEVWGGAHPLRRSDSGTQGPWRTSGPD